MITFINFLLEEFYKLLNLRKLQKECVFYHKLYNLDIY